MGKGDSGKVNERDSRTAKGRREEHNARTGSREGKGCELVTHNNNNNNNKHT